MAEKKKEHKLFTHSPSINGLIAGKDQKVNYSSSVVMNAFN